MVQPRADGSPSTPGGWAAGGPPSCLGELRWGQRHSLQGPAGEPPGSQDRAQDGAQRTTWAGGARREGTWGAWGSAHPGSAELQEMEGFPQVDPFTSSAPPGVQVSWPGRGDLGDLSLGRRWPQPPCLGLTQQEGTGSGPGRVSLDPGGVQMWWVDAFPERGTGV